jgi:hypothetical protein
VNPLLPKQPGKSYMEMRRIIDDNSVNGLPPVFTTELILGLCWEESKFNNVMQGEAGSAIGFGQAEPSQFWTLQSNEAKKNNYYVPNLPPTKKIGDSTFSTRPLTDAQSIQVVTGMLSHLYWSNGRQKQAALEGYAGIKFSKQMDELEATGKITHEKHIKIDPLGVGGRRKKISGWVACETKLIPVAMMKGDPREAILDSLQFAEGFAPLRKQFAKILFPESDDYWKNFPASVKFGY